MSVRRRLVCDRVQSTKSMNQEAKEFREGIDTVRVAIIALDYLACSLYVYDRTRDGVVPARWWAVSNDIRDEYRAQASEKMRQWANEESMNEQAAAEARASFSASRGDAQ